MRKIKEVLKLKWEYGSSNKQIAKSCNIAHRKEIENFSRFTSSDAIKFHSMTYQELIVKLARDYRSDHPEYIKYLSERYL